MPGWEWGILVCETQYKDNVIDLHAVKVSPEGGLGARLSGQAHAVQA